MPAADIWTINHETGGGDGVKLNDCTIERTATQTMLFAPDGVLLGTVDSVEPPITFGPFSLPRDPDLKFMLTILRFDYGPASDETHGPWETLDAPEKEPQSGEWTAQAGVGPKGESAAAADAS